MLYDVQYERASHDFYIEPAWCLDALLDRLPLSTLHDPCAGTGVIVTAALQRGVAATGADIVDRAYGMFPTRDYFTDAASYANIVTNPPFRLAEQIIEHALDHVTPGGNVAVLARVAFLAAQCRHALFCRPETALVLVFSRRPSMPPGDELAAGEVTRGGGKTDYCWIVFHRGHAGGARIEWTL
jgi:hypothetical protein